MLLQIALELLHPTHRSEVEITVPSPSRRASVGVVVFAFVSEQPPPK